MVERFDAQILFVPMEVGDNKDPQHSHAVISKMANAQRASVLKGAYPAGAVLGLMKHMSFAVGMRLHFLIFAGIQKIPFVSLPYAAKVSGFLADLKMPMPPISGLNVGKLCAYLDRSWDLRAQIKKRLEESVPPLQERAKKTNQVLYDLLRDLEPKRMSACSSPAMRSLCARCFAVKNRFPARCRHVAASWRRRRMFWSSVEGPQGSARCWALHSPVQTSFWQSAMVSSAATQRRLSSCH